MIGASNIDAETTALAIAAVRESWLEAVKSGDAERLAQFVTDDVVVVHGNGHCVSGKDALIAEFQEAFARFAIKQRAAAPEIVVRGEWACEISTVETRLIPYAGGEPVEVVSTTIVALRRQPDSAWKIARVVGLLQSE